MGKGKNATRSTHIGGACFTPRMAEGKRPPYPPASKILFEAFVEHTRGPAIATVLLFLLQPLYEQVRAWFANQAPLDLGTLPANLPAGLGSKRLVFPCDDRLWFSLGTTLIHTVCYFGINGMFSMWDRFGIFERYKLDRKPYMKIKASVWRKTMVEAILNQFVSTPLVTYTLVFPVYQYFGAPAWDAALPAWHIVFLGFVAAKAFNEIVFYYSHRALHAAWIYRQIHKQHHTYIGTIGFAAEYAHPIEQILSNQAPTLGGCLIAGMPLSVWFLWLAWRLEQTYEAHSGYCFYGTWAHAIGLTNSEAAAYHDYHHTGNRGNFGAAYLDWFHGTMDSWLAEGGIEGYIAKKNHGKPLSRKEILEAEAEVRNAAHTGVDLSGKSKKN